MMGANFSCLLPAAAGGPAVLLLLLPRQWTNSFPHPILHPAFYRGADKSRLVTNVLFRWV